MGSPKGPLLQCKMKPILYGIHQTKCPNCLGTSLYKEKLQKKQIQLLKGRALVGLSWIWEAVRHLLSQQSSSEADYPALHARSWAQLQHMFFAFLAEVTVVFPFLFLSPQLSLALTLTGAINASSKYSQPYKDFSKLRFTSKLWATSCVLNGIQMKVFQSLYSIIIIKTISKSLKWVTAFPILVLGSINNV